MNVAVFCAVVAAGLVLVLAQGVCAHASGYLTQAQMRVRGIEGGWSFLQHGGMWADVFLIPFVVGYFASSYRLAYFSGPGLAVLGVAVGAAFWLGSWWQRRGAASPEVHTNAGRTTIAGWIHGLYAVAAMWTCGLVFLDLATPSISRSDVVVISLALTPFFFLGLAKFSARWRFQPAARRQFVVETIGLWVVAGLRIAST